MHTCKFSGVSDSCIYTIMIYHTDLIFLGKEITSYFNWGENQPSDGDEHYCMAMRRSDGFRWHNMFCKGEYPFICMIGRYYLLSSL